MRGLKRPALSLRPAESGMKVSQMVSQTFTSWNQIGECLRRLDVLRRALEIRLG